jgi:hypothetical protein
MPNWCDNYIQITGEKKNLDKIKFFIRECAKEQSGLFSTLVGLPPNATPENYEKNWFETNVEWWGCKWDVHYEDNGCWELDEDDEISLHIDTAWSPPIPFCQKLANMFDVVVRVEYNEMGCNFAGYSLYDKDGLVSEEYYNDYLKGMYFINKEQFWSEIEYRIDSWYDEAQDEEEFDLEATLNSEFDFCTEEDINEIRKQYLENKPETNEQEA